MELHPARRPPPRTGTGTGTAALPRLCGQDQLNHPALTGMDPADLDALAAALDIHFRAWREQHLHAKRGRGRIRAAGAGGPRKIDITGYLIAGVAAALLAVKPSTVSKATGLTARPWPPCQPASSPRPPRPPSSPCAPSTTCANTPPGTASPSAARRQPTPRQMPH